LVFVNGSADFGKRVTCTISRNGDLIHRVYLQVTLPSWTPTAGGSATKGWCDYVGHALIRNVEVEVGGQRIKLIGAEKYQALNTICVC
jgi:hypothetical protein